MKAATGEWIGFVDGDDVIEPDMYERLLANAIQYSSQISHCGYQMCFPDGRVNYFYNTGRIMRQDNNKGIKDLLDGSIVEPGLWNKLYHKSLFLGLLSENAMDEDIKINEDLLMNYYLFKEADKSIFEDWCPYHYLVRYTSASRQSLNDHRIWDPIKVKEAILLDAPMELKEAAQAAYMGTMINAYNTLIVCNPEKKIKEDASRIRECIVRNKRYLNNCRQNTKILGDMICGMPLIYPIFYRNYTKWFQKKKYD